MTRRLKIADPTLMIWVLLATLLGFFFIFDAGYAREIAQNRSPFSGEIRQQFFALIAGIVAFCGLSLISPEKWKRWSKGLWVISFVSLLLVKAPVIGLTLNGAARWIKLGPVTIQPAEFAKLAVILYLAGLLAHRDQWKAKPARDWGQNLDRNFMKWLPRLLPALWVLIAIWLIEDEPDLGTASIVAGIAGAMFLAGGVRWKSILGIGAVGALMIGWLVTHESYRMDRFNAHATRWEAEHVDTMGYQTVQSELAMAMGGAFGVGPGGGRGKQVMPAATTDFMMTTVAEEMGFVGSMAVLTVLGAICFRLIKLAGKAATPFGGLVLAGFAAWIGVQTSVNIMMANGFLPAIGVPLPFLSYGGSSLMALWMALGVSNSVLLAKPVEVDSKEAARAPSGHRGRNRRARLSGA